MKGISKSEARKILIRCSRLGIPYVYGRGYRWMMDVLRPSISRLKSSRGQGDRRLVSTAFYRLRDVHDFNHAPLAAIRSYRQSLKADPSEAAAWREIGCMYERLGASRKALLALRRAVKMDPEDVYARDDLEGVEECGSRAVYPRRNRIWQSSELLARQRFKAALHVLRAAHSVKEIQARARVLGALGDCERVLHEWRRIAASKGPVEMEGADGFFLPQPLFRTSSWWRILLSMKSRWACGFWSSHPSLDARLPRPSATYNSPAEVRWSRRRPELLVRYQLARVEKDAKAAAGLARRYPGWKEAVRLARKLRRLSSASRLP